MLEDHKVLPVKSKLEELRGHKVIKVNIKTGGVTRSQSRTSKIKTWGVTKAHRDEICCWMKMKIQQGEAPKLLPPGDRSRLRQPGDENV